MDTDIFELFERLVEIEISGKNRKVPQTILCRAVSNFFRWKSFATEIFAKTATSQTVKPGSKTPQRKHQFLPVGQKFNRE
jgi:hypothetical protein